MMAGSFVSTIILSLQIIIVAIFALLTVTAIIIPVGHPAPQNEMMDALEDETERQTGTKVFNLVYYDAKGNALNYYICATIYCEEDMLRMAESVLANTANPADP